jgi:3-oxoacyl-[acyl-carrier-protein] synthase-3
MINENIKIGQAAKLNGSKIAGVVTCCGNQKISNEFFLDRFTKEEIKNFEKITGVHTRYWVDEDNSGIQLSIKTAIKLLNGLNWSPLEIDAVIYVTQTPEKILPATAIRLASNLGLKTGVVAFDINLGCSGYPYGLYVLMSMVQTGLIRKGLLIATETPSKLIDKNDRSTAMLFGDAASATAIEIDENTTEFSHFILGSDGEGKDNLVIPSSRFSKNLMEQDKRLIGKNHNFLFMDGPEIFNFTIKRVPSLFKESIKEAGVDPELYLFHQANKFMIEYLRKKIQTTNEKVPINIEKYGNTSVVSIPLLITDKNIKKHFESQSVIVGLYGFGVGYSWASCITRLNKNIYIAHIEN